MPIRAGHATAHRHGERLTARPRPGSRAGPRRTGGVRSGADDAGRADLGCDRGARRAAAGGDAARLGARAVDPDAGTIEVAFRAREKFLNPSGAIQGGFLAAMLDDTLGPALVATLGPGEWAPTTDLHVQFLAPARPGRLIGHGRVVRRGGGVAFLAGELRRDDGTVVATAVATAALRRA
jgi:uncharacterized protein (TIGR00369 family)